MTCMRRLVRFARSLRRDTRDAIRQIVRAPASAAAAAASLALGMTTLVAAASALNALLFAELPGIADRSSLVTVRTVRVEPRVLRRVEPQCQRDGLQRANRRLGMRRRRVGVTQRTRQ